MPDLPDTDLQLKKRARRRLVGAVAFAGLAAVVLPMIMDEEPKPPAQDVRILIPSQDQPPFKPTLESAGGARTETPARPAEPVQPAPPARPVDSPIVRPVEPPDVRTVEPPAARPVEKPTPRPADKPMPKPTQQPTEKQTDAQRAEAILSGKTTGEPASAKSEVPFVILIGAYAKPANVKQLQTKIGELGVKVYTEPLESPGGVKTRVRAGPFANRAAAEKALEKMKRIGVNGVIAAKQ
ncbi:MAG: SPOR domain-containing protein [Candidatus Accumulibacter sp.]|jgi:DedD protein|nr:SPOR domain-containing protein [Accumulibacter sp.]